MIANRFGQLIAIMAIAFFAGAACAETDAPTMLDPGESPPSSEPPPPPPPPPPTADGRISEDQAGFFTQYCLDLCGDTSPADGIPDHVKRSAQIFPQNGERRSCEVLGQVNFRNMTVSDTIKFECVAFTNSGGQYTVNFENLNDATQPGAAERMVEISHFDLNNSNWADGGNNSPFGNAGGCSFEHGFRVNLGGEDPREVYLEYGKFRGSARLGLGPAHINKVWAEDFCSNEPGAGGAGTHNEVWFNQFGNGVVVENSVFRGNYANWGDSGPSASGFIFLGAESGPSSIEVTIRNNLFDAQNATSTDFNVGISLGGGARNNVTIEDNDAINFVRSGFSSVNSCPGSGFRWSNNTRNGSSVGDPCN